MLAKDENQFPQLNWI